MDHLEQLVCLLSVGRGPLKAVLILLNLLLQLYTDLAPPDLHTNTDNNKCSEANQHKATQLAT
jgi:hypothetical protein